MRRRTKANLNWNIWKPPFKQNIQYSSIYEKRRDFQRLTRKMRIEGPYLSEMSSCSIFDQTENPSEKQMKMDVILFDLSGKMSCLLLQLIFDENSLNSKSNSLLIFLSKSNMCKIYELCDSRLYISCKDGLKWPLFYDVFGFLIQKPSKTIIGITFYVHFVCNNLIIKELNFLHISYTCHSETKIPNSSEPVNLKKENEPESAKISIGKLQAHNSPYKLPLKRKLDASKQELSGYKSSYKVSCRCKETKWQVFKPVLKSDVIDYKHILEAKGILNNFKSPLSQPPGSCLGLYETFSRKGKGQPTESIKGLKLGEDLKNEVHSKRKFPSDCTENDMPYTKEKHSKLSNNCMTREAKIKRDEPLKNASNLHINVSHKASSVKICSTSMSSRETIPKVNIRNDTPLKKQIFVECNEQHMKDHTFKNAKCELNSGNISVSEKPDCQSEFPTFQTASGKSFPISDKARQIAEKIYNEVCSQATDLDKQEEANKDDSSKNIKCGFNSAHISDPGKLSTDCQSEFPTFQTASGKSFPISEKARQIAEKIYNEVCSQATDGDKEEANNPSTTKLKKEFNDDELDSFFLNVFDDRDNQGSPSQSNVNSQFQAKARKSLGGRRTLKPYSKF